MTTNLTRNGVAKDLSKSPYVYTYVYHGLKVSLHFSSQLHLNNFNKNRQKNYAMLYNYINKRFKIKVDCTILSDMNLYQKVENRGCYVKIDNTVYNDLKNLSLR